LGNFSPTDFLELQADQLHRDHDANANAKTLLPPLPQLACSPHPLSQTWP
jgi:hypothetical protein